MTDTLILPLEADSMAVITQETRTHSGPPPPLPTPPSRQASTVELLNHEAATLTTKIFGALKPRKTVR
jgi:hypothetical protein